MPSALIHRFSRLSYRWPLLIILATGALLFILFSSTDKPQPVKTRSSEWSVNTMPVVFKPQSLEATLYGRVETPTFASLSSAVTAYIEAVPVLEGQAVQKGELLVALDSRDQQLIVAQREADVADIDARLKSEKLRVHLNKSALEQEEILLTNAEKEKNRQLSLKEKNLISESKVETAISNLAKQQLIVLNREQLVNDAGNRLNQLEAQLSRAEALLEQARLDLERGQVKAPFAGRISHVKVAEGERVRSGDILVEMYDNEQLEIRAQIPDRYLPVIRKYSQAARNVTAKLRTGEETTPLQLNRLAASVDSGRGGVDAMFRLAPGEERELVHGRARIIELEVPLGRQVLRIPPGSLYRDSYLYRVDKESKLQAVEVKHLGDMSEAGDEWLLVSSPELKTGDRILLTRIASAISGMKVNVKDDVKDRVKDSVSTDAEGNEATL